MKSVLILDANQRSALAATRSLGKKGIHVVAADESKSTLAGSSKYCKETFIYPSPYKRPAGFIAALRKESAARGVGVIFPMTEIAAHLVLEHRPEFGDISIPFAPFQTFETLTDKWTLCELARRLAVPIPTTYFALTYHDLVQIYPHLTFPVVLKPHRSRISSDGLWIAAAVQYAGSRQEMEDTIARHEYFNRHPFLVQEYIHGQSTGVFALYDRGKPVVFFAHRRLRQKPPSGGVSVLSESTEIDPRLRELAQRILDDVNWHGVAMVEFKVSPDRTPFLMEVNARFWGSLQLAIDAGVDFPYLLYRLAVGEPLENVTGYRIGTKTRWLLGDLDHLYLTFKNSSELPHARPSKWRTLIQFLNLFPKSTRYEVNRWDDLRPFFVELNQYLRG